MPLAGPGPFEAGGRGADPEKNRPRALGPGADMSGGHAAADQAVTCRRLRRMKPSMPMAEPRSSMVPGSGVAAAFTWKPWMA